MTSALTAPASLIAAASATEQPVPRTHVPAIDHALKARALQTNWMARAIGNTTATAQVFAMGMDSEGWGELSQLQQAAWQRLRAMQQGWVQDWKDWFQYSDQVKGANTMSKLVERECNVAAQMTQLLGNQATGLVGLLENVQVDYSYWISEKLSEKRRKTKME